MFFAQVNSFCDFPGTKLNQGNKPKQLKNVLHKLTLLADFIWSGKAPGKPKNAFKGYTNFVRVLRLILVKLEGRYDEAVFLDHFKNKIIKHAYV